MIADTGSVVLAPDGTLCARMTMNFIALFDVPSRTEKLRLQTIGSVPQVLAFSRRTPHIVGGNVDGMVQIWDRTTGKLTGTINAHKSSIEAIDRSPSE